ncbi:MAG: beta-glucosidase BglX [Prevotella sp.]|nr:beta-glucosidase BglX [Prevotella sp.]
MKRLALLMAITLSITMGSAAKDKKKTQQPLKPMNEFVSELMDKMTVQEKIGQLNLLPLGDIQTGISENSSVSEAIRQGRLSAILNLKGVDNILKVQKMAVEESRLGIPLIFGMDVIHGYETIFPIPLALACSWDIPAIEQSARIAAKEATADGLCWTYSPMVDISVDPRWGRVAEGAGEDPFLGSRIAEAMVRGYQGTPAFNYQFSIFNLMACLKHYALYGGSEAGRDYNTVDMSRIRMYNQYFSPYKAAVEAGVGSVMSSFNTVDYVPATANRWLLTDVLRQQWKFDGFVVTDYGAINEMMNHGLGNQQQVAALALKAGTDMDMCSEAFTATLEKSLQEGKVTMEDIDQACRRVLEAKYKLGLFADPYRYCDKSRRATDIYTPEHRQAARNLAAETFVLLKNDNVLPLKKQGTIALIGPLADTKSNIPGSWAPTATYQYPTLLDGMKRALQDKATLLYAQGSNICRDSVLQADGSFNHFIPRGDDAKMKQQALEVARKADVIVCAMGELQEMSGESSSRSNIELFDVQRELLEELLKLGKPVVLLNFAGRPTVLTWEQQHVPAILNVWFAGSETGDAICDVLFGDKSPSGRLTMSMPQNMGQIPVYYNHLNTGRPVGEGTQKFVKFQSNYLDVRNEPLYPFGYGLSYTTFEYSDVTLSNNQMTVDGAITASVTVKNMGGYDADEVVQLYIRDVVGSISRPVKELKGFQRIHLNAGESQTVTFEITPDLLKFYDYNLDYVIEPGDFDIMIGPNSRDVKKKTITIL